MAFRFEEREPGGFEEIFVEMDRYAIAFFVFPAPWSGKERSG